MTTPTGPVPSVFPAYLTIVTLGVADLTRALRFYDALGWRRSASSVDGVIVWYDLGGVWLGLFPEHELAADSGLPAAPGAPAAPAAARAGAGGAATVFRGATYALNVPDRSIVDGALAAAAGAGATVTLEPVETDYGVYHACFADPDGHVWEVAHNPGFPIVEGRTVIP
jgi:hypothetical protein